MSLASLQADARFAFHKGAITRRAFEIGRFALQLGRARRAPKAKRGKFRRINRHRVGV